MPTTSCLPPLDAFGEEYQQEPTAPLARLREEAPVHPMTEPGWFIVTTRALAVEVLTSPARFSNQVSRRTQPPPEVAAEVEALRAQGLPYMPTLLMSDPPAHTRYRGLVQRAFTPRALSWMEPLIADVAAELAAALPAGEPFELVERFALPLPVWAISRVLGLPDDRRDDVRRWTEAATASIGSRLTPERWLDVERAQLECRQYLAEELERRRHEPTEDILGLLMRGSVESADDARPVGVAELVGLSREIMAAGNESTLRLLVDIVWQLDRRPEEWARVRVDPARADAIVDEAVRLASPSAAVMRHVTADTTLGGVALPAGSTLVVSLLSANRDATVFEDADVFDPDRLNSGRHIAFGRGIHACIGNVLARMEAREAVKALAHQVERIEVVDEAELRYLPSLILRGLAGLPVRVERRRPAAT